VRITKLAKVGQQSLVDSVKECCGAPTSGNSATGTGGTGGTGTGGTGTGSGAFNPYSSGLESLVNQAAVNVSAIAGSVVTNTEAPTTLPASRIIGRLFNSGGIKDCKVCAPGSGCLLDALMLCSGGLLTAETIIALSPSPTHSQPLTLTPHTSQTPTQGTYEALLTGDKMDLVTDALGAFQVEEPQLAQYRFSAALPGSVCKDAVTGAIIRFPLSLYVPPVVSTAVTSVALLTVPAADDPSVAQMYDGKVTDGRAPHYLWTHAYKLFGYDANELGVSFYARAARVGWDGGGGGGSV